MGPKPSRVAERRQAQEAVAARRRRTSILAGVLGLGLLFAGGIGVILSPPSALVLIVAMTSGVVLLLVAFFLVRGSLVSLPARPRDK